MRSRTVLITGATDGLGRAVAMRLAEAGASLHLHGRDPAKLAATAADIAAATGNRRILTHRADLAALDDARRLADQVTAAAPQLDVVINNAGIGSGKPDKADRQESADGYELRFAVNYLAGFVLTLRLVSLLRRSAPSRVVNVASLGQSAIDFDDVMLRNAYSGQRAYGQSKLAQIMFGIELAQRLSADGVTVNSLHPATYMPTKIVLDEIGYAVDSLEQGVDATVRLAADPELDGVTGRFFSGIDLARPHPQACDSEVRGQLWELSLALSGEADPTKHS